VIHKQDLFQLKDERIEYYRIPSIIIEIEMMEKHHKMRNILIEIPSDH